MRSKYARMSMSTMKAMLTPKGMHIIITLVGGPSCTAQFSQLTTHIYTIKAPNTLYTQCIRMGEVVFVV